MWGAPSGICGIWLEGKSPMCKVRTMQLYVQGSLHCVPVAACFLTQVDATAVLSCFLLGSGTEGQLHHFSGRMAFHCYLVTILTIDQRGDPDLLHHFQLLIVQPIYPIQVSSAFLRVFPAVAPNKSSPMTHQNWWMLPIPALGWACERKRASTSVADNTNSSIMVAGRLVWSCTI